MHACMQVCQDHRSLVQLTAKVQQLGKGLGEQVLARQEVAAGGHL